MAVKEDPKIYAFVGASRGLEDGGAGGQVDILVRYTRVLS